MTRSDEVEAILEAMDEVLRVRGAYEEDGQPTYEYTEASAQRAHNIVTALDLAEAAIKQLGVLVADENNDTVGAVHDCLTYRSNAAWDKGLDGDQHRAPVLSEDQVKAWVGLLAAVLQDRLEGKQ